MWSLARTLQVISACAMTVVLGVSIAGIGTGWVHVPNAAAEGCTLEPVYGDLVERWGRTALSNSSWLSQSGWDGPLVWPDGWSLRTVEGGALEVVDPDGVARARTGTRISIWAASEYGSPIVTLGQLLVCPYQPFGEWDAG